MNKSTSFFTLPGCALVAVAVFTFPFLMHCSGGGPSGPGTPGTPGKPNEGAPIITQQPANKSGAVGSKVVFTVVAKGKPTLSYTWYADGKAVDKAKGPEFVIEKLEKDMDGRVFYVTVSNSLGKVDSAKAKLTVTGQPNPGPAPKPGPSPQPAPKPGPSPQPAPKPGPSPQPTPKPGPSPQPTPTPKPGPSPQPAPTPKPGPSPQPAPTPKPGPSPQPTPPDGPKPPKPEPKPPTPAPPAPNSPKLGPKPPVPSPTPGPTPGSKPVPNDGEGAPKVLEQPKSIIVPVGSTAQFSIKVSGDPKPEISWIMVDPKDATVKEIGSGDSVKVENVTMAMDKSKVRARIVNDKGSLISQDAILTVSNEAGVTVAFNASNGGRIEGNCSQLVAVGVGTETVKAVPEPGYRFNFWTRNGEIAVRDSALQLACINEDTTLTAHFVPDGRMVVGSMAQDMVGMDSSGHKVALSEYYGRPIILAILNEGSDMSREQAAQFSQLHDAFLAGMNINSIAVLAKDYSQKTPDQSFLATWVNDYQFGSRVQNDLSGRSNRMLGRNSEGPVFVLIDNDFKVCGVYQDLRKMLTVLVQNPNILGRGLIKVPAGVTPSNLSYLLDRFMK